MKSPLMWMVMVSTALPASSWAQPGSALDHRLGQWNYYDVERSGWQQHEKYLGPACEPKSRMTFGNSHDFIASVAFSPDAKTLAGVCFDNRVS